MPSFNDPIIDTRLDSSPSTPRATRSVPASATRQPDTARGQSAIADMKKSGV